MLTHLMTPPGAISVEESWTDANERALTLAYAAEWQAAAELWTSALAEAPAFALAPETHALLLSNLAQARFRCGDFDGAVELGRRSLAARLLCCENESDAPIARARADLAVYLTAAGQTDDAATILERAYSSLELQFGSEDPRLLSVLENQARLALVAHSPAIAEPLLLRLHALLDAVGDDPTRIEPLIARVAAARTDRGESVHQAPHEIDEELFAHEAIVEQREDARDDMSRHEAFPHIMDDEFDLIDDAKHTPLSSPSAHTIRSEGLIEPGLHATPSWTARTNPLGFEVQYGVPTEELYAVPPHSLRDE